MFLKFRMTWKMTWKKKTKNGMMKREGKKVYKKEDYDLNVVTQTLKDARALDVVVMDMSGKTDWVKYMVFATGRSGSHILSMANSLVDELKSRRKGMWNVQQKECEFWVIVNSGDILVNIFTEEERADFDLERSWIFRRNKQFHFLQNEELRKELMFMFDDEDGVLEAMEDNVSRSEPMFDDEVPSKERRKRFSMDWKNKTVVEEVKEVSRESKGLKKERKVKKISNESARKNKTIVEDVKEVPRESKGLKKERKKKSGKSIVTVNEV